jgi:SWI/SNF-related matrix-associated actin-dependent regulator of chromatin subfamily A member 5
MQIKYTVSTTNKKVYTEEEDKFLVVMLHKHGVEGEFIYEKIRDEIRESPLFRFDWFFLSRTPQEIGRRCTTLISAIVRELGEGDVKNKNGKRGYEDEETEEEEEVEQPKGKKAKNGVKVC